MMFDAVKALMMVFEGDEGFDDLYCMTCYLDLDDGWT